MINRWVVIQFGRVSLGSSALGTCIKHVLYYKREREREKKKKREREKGKKSERERMSILVSDSMGQTLV